MKLEYSVEHANGLSFYVVPRRFQVVRQSQVQHYTDTISKRTDWDLVDIYADDVRPE